MDFRLEEISIPLPAIWENEMYGVLVVDQHGVILEKNKSIPSYARIEDVVVHDDLKHFHHLLQQAKKERFAQGTITLHEAKGRIKNFPVTIYTVEHSVSETSPIFIVLWEWMNLSAPNENPIYHHPILKMANRNYLQHKLLQTIEAFPYEPIFFYVLQITSYDGFVRQAGLKKANEILIETANRLRQIESEQLLISYFERDEFLIAAFHQPVESLKSIANTIISQFDTPFHMNTRYTIMLKAKIGASVYPTDTKFEEELYQMALIALNGPPCHVHPDVYIYHANDSMETLKSFILTSQIHDALHNGQIEQWYQPKINIQTNRVSGAESLLRWNHPEWGIIHAYEFISIVNQADMILEVSIWAFHHLCRKIREWKDQNLYVPVLSINLPGIALMNMDLGKNILDIMEQYQIPASAIALEISETNQIWDENEALNILGFLADRGITISLDNFGKTYAGLYYFRRLPLNEVKLDRSFIQEIEEDNTLQTILQSVVTMAHGVHMTVVAEGIETSEQLSILRNLHVDEGQGYLWSPAISKHEFERILADPAAWIATFDLADQPYTGPDRRQYFRIPIEVGMLGQLSLYELGGKRVKTGNTEIVIENIGPGGLRFLSTLRFPVKVDFRVKWTIKFDDQYYTYIGRIVWLREQKKGVIRYGAIFEMEDHERAHLIQLLNSFAIHLRRSSSYQGGYDLLQKDKYAYFSNKLI